MTPGATLFVRRFTAAGAVSWALIAIAVSFYALFSQGPGLSLPLDFSFITGSAQVSSVTPQAAAAGVEPGDRVLTVDGFPAIHLLRFPLELKSGRTHVIELEKPDGQIVTTYIAPVPSHVAARAYDGVLHVGLLFLAALYIVIAALVWWGKPDRDETWALLLFSCTASVLLSSGVRADLFSWSGARAIAVLPWLGAAAFHLFSTYPIQPRWLESRAWLRSIPYGIALAISVVLLAVTRLRISADWPEQAAFYTGASMAIASMVILAAERRRANRAGVGERADLMLAAGVVSFLPGVVVAALPLFVAVHLPWYAALLPMAFFPLAVSYGMVRRQLFDFRVAARSSATYGVASLVVTGGFALLVTFTDEIVLLSGVTARWVQILALFVAILTFNPIRDRIQRLVDRLFDRHRARYRAAVGEVAEALVSVSSVEEVRERILTVLTEVMGVRRAMLMFVDEDGGRVVPEAWAGDWPDPGDAFYLSRQHPVVQNLAAGPDERARIDFDDEPDALERQRCWELFDSQEIELLVPILFEHVLLGVIAVGSKANGDRIGMADRQLLRTLANQSAIGLENAKAFDEIAQLNENLEERVEKRTRELREIQAQLIQSEKLKSLGQLVAGVAHEINNPIGFVHANLQLLDEYIQELLRDDSSPENVERARDAISRLLARSREGTERVKGIVQELRTFSRMDQAALQEADLNKELERTVALMSPRLRGVVKLVRDYEPLPAVRCYPGQLNQVFLNLLMNACDAMPEGGFVTVRSRVRDGGVLLEVADTGPGIAPEILSEIFDPFFTTKGVGKGTGLGLSTSHDIVERHRGRIYASSNPEGGTIFSIELPLDVAAVAE